MFNPILTNIFPKVILALKVRHIFYLANKYIILFLLILLCNASLKAQDTEFWFVAAETSSSFIMLTNISNSPANVIIETWKGSTTPTIESLEIAPGSCFRKNWTSSTGIFNPLSLAGTVTNYGIHIISDQLLTGYYTVNPYGGKDIFTFKGKNALGTDFYVPFQNDHYFSANNVNDPEQLNIVATEDGTDITFTPSVDCRNTGGTKYLRGNTYTITGLKKGQTFMLAEATINSQYSLSGSHITSTKPVALTISCMNLSGGPGAGAGDSAGDQIVPVDNLGKRYIVVKGFTYGYSNSPRDRIYFTGTKDGTTITINYEIGGGTTTTTLTADAGQTVFFDMGNNYLSGGSILAYEPKVAYIEADKQLYCFHHSGVGREVGAALLPSLYSIGQKTLSFYQMGITDYITDNYAFVVFRNNSENNFTIDYDGNTFPLPVTANPIPNINDWKWGKVALPSGANEKYVTIKNDASSFSLGYFAYQNDLTALYGYMSTFGDLNFPDTTYICKGSSVTLDAGYALSYYWQLPDGSTSTNPTVTSTLTGKYKVTVNLDPVIQSDSVVILNRFDNISISNNIIADIAGTSVKIIADLNETTTENLKYEWFVNNFIYSTEKDSIKILWDNINKQVKLVITDTILGCISDTLTTYIPQIPDNINDANCTITPPGTLFSIKQLAVSNASDIAYSVATPLVGDIDNDGITEIIVAGGVYPNTPTYTSYLIQIFEVRNNQILLQQSLSVPGMGGIYAAPFSFAKVDGNDYAAIFLCTRTGSNATADQRQLIKYIYDGTSYVEEKRAQYSSVSTKEGGIPYIADFNGDGRAEVVVYDKIFDAQTLTLLADGNLLNNTTMGFGLGAYPTTGTNYGSYMAIGDMDGDGLPEVVAGDCVYKVKITNTSGISGNNFALWSKCDGTGPNGEAHNDVGDGPTAIADMDGDGLLDVIVTVKGSVNKLSNNGSVYIWNPRTKKVLHQNVINNIAVLSVSVGPSVPFIGDIDNDGEPEICFTGYKKMYAFDYDATTKALNQKWAQPTSDASACTTMSMFDFNQDGFTELVYRDETHLRIISGVTGLNITTFEVKSGTGNEYPIVADINGDGAAEIIVVGCASGYTHGQVWIYSSNPAGTWAPARSVWNQFQYNAVNINEDLTIPQHQLNPATLFPGDGTSIRPYNAFLQQQTLLDKNGTPIWLTPDVFPDQSISNSSLSGNTVSITVGIINQGDAAIGPPVHVTLYKESVSAGNELASDSANIQILKGDTGYVTVTIADITPHQPIVNIVAKINDKGNMYIYQPECDSLNNEITFLNPALSLLMTKNATLNNEKNNGTYSNPVSILFNEDIEYKIKAVNANQSSGTVIIRDTLPKYLDCVPGSISSGGLVSSTNQRDFITWIFSGVSPMDSLFVKFKATPKSGCCSSQPMFINKAWITASDTLHIPTNETYHQGACVGIITFSGRLGGSIYHAEEQPVDYKAKAKTGVIIVPDDGYRFAGWSHDNYISLRGELIGAQENIMYYDTLTIWGNVELVANFKIQNYQIHYYLNGATNSPANPSLYNISSETIHLKSPEKEGDVFIGWTGSNGDIPQMAVNIPNGTIGELEFHANFLYSGREDSVKEVCTEDKIWATGNELFIKTKNIGSMIKIYSIDGILQKEQNITSVGETRIKLPQGIYIVTLNNSIGHKIIIN